MDVSQVVSDLSAEQEALDSVVADITKEQWAAPTSSERWSVSDQIGHLAYFDGTAALAITNSEAFAEAKQYLFTSLGSSPEEADNATLAEYRAMGPPELLSAWRKNRGVLAAAAATLTNKDRVPWYGPSMGSKSFLTARLMECWAHGQHICDTVGATRTPTERLRHIAQLGVITRNWTYINRGLETPTEDVLVTLQAPSGEQWTWGEPDAASTVAGSAEEFCLVVTQCRHYTSTELAVSGDPAHEWLGMAQAFAGAATTGPTV